MKLLTEHTDFGPVNYSHEKRDVYKCCYQQWLNKDGANVLIDERKIWVDNPTGFLGLLIKWNNTTTGWSYVPTMCVREI